MREQLKKSLGYHRIARIRGFANRLSRGRVGLYSTAEHYSTGPSATVLRYYQYDATKQIVCPHCARTGSGQEGSSEHFSELFDVRCPRCRTMLLVVGYPTFEEVEDAANRGNEEAISELAQISGVPG